MSRLFQNLFRVFSGSDVYVLPIPYNLRMGRLYNSSGDELANWLTDGKPHGLIRVPEGDYSLELHYGEQMQELRYSVTSEQTLQEIDIATFLEGSEPRAVAAVRFSPLTAALLIVSGLALAGLAVVGIVWFRKYRRRGGGYH